MIIDNVIIEESFRSGYTALVIIKQDQSNIPKGVDWMKYIHLFNHDRTYSQTVAFFTKVIKKKILANRGANLSGYSVVRMLYVVPCYQM